MPRKDGHRQGQAAEDLALEFLESRGLKLEARNFRWRGGEIDLIMRDGAEWVFVEVRYRASSAFGQPQATVDQVKQRRIALAAARFLGRHDDRPCRFDVVALSGKPPRIHWIRNAFDAPAW